jgi:hypothetical protein
MSDCDYSCNLYGDLCPMHGAAPALLAALKALANEYLAIVEGEWATTPNAETDPIYGQALAALGKAEGKP